MKKLSEKALRQYIYQNFVKVDGLWFVTVEQHYGFDRALELDKKVWQVLPKMQARFLKKELGLGDSIENLLEAINLKMEIDGFKFSSKIESVEAISALKYQDHKITENQPPFLKEIIRVDITACPWHEIMLKAKRKDLSGKIGSLICKTEYISFAKEFISNIEIKIEEQICRGSRLCTFHFLNNG
jgi:hypothetical protein